MLPQSLGHGIGDGIAVEHGDQRCEKLQIHPRFVAAVQPAPQTGEEPVKATEVVEEEIPQEEEVPVDEAPVGFWTDLVSAIRQELQPPVSGFFTTSVNAPVTGRIQAGQLLLCCANAFTMEMINKPEILALVSRKAAAIFGKNIPVKVIDSTVKPEISQRMEQLMSFGREHSDIVRIKD